MTSVAARTPVATIASAAASFRVAITRTASDTTSSGASPFLIAVAMTPDPIGFVSTSWSPGLAPALVTIRSGCTSPIATSPYFGSASSIVWPPSVGMPHGTCDLAAPAQDLLEDTLRQELSAGS